MTFCTNFPAAHLVAPMEQELGLPIYDTVSIGVWDALRRAGVETARGARWGSLFTGTMKTLIRNARVLTLRCARTAIIRAPTFLIDGTTISAIGPDLPVPPDARIRSKPPESSRCRGSSTGISIRRQACWRARWRIGRSNCSCCSKCRRAELAEADPRLTYLTTMLGAIEMLKCGVTAVHDDAFHNPYPTHGLHLGA